MKEGEKGFRNYKVKKVIFDSPDAEAEVNVTDVAKEALRIAANQHGGVVIGNTVMISDCRVIKKDYVAVPARSQLLGCRVNFIEVDR